MDMQEALRLIHEHPRRTMYAAKFPPYGLRSHGLWIEESVAEEMDGFGYVAFQGGSRFKVTERGKQAAREAAGSSG